MNEDESKTHMSLWSILAAPLLAGNDLSKMSPSTLAILTNSEVIQVDQDSAGVQGRRIRQVGPVEIWMKPLSDGSKAVGLFNSDWGSMPLTVNFRDIGLGSSATVRDLWAHKYLGVLNESFTASVPKHGVVMIKAK